jgi:hypothetical protein
VQDRYTGDIGDYIKLAILRAVGHEYRLGVIWWLYPDESHNADGKHIAYLHSPLKWRQRDASLFDALKEIVISGQRTVAALERARLLPNAEYFGLPIPTAGSSFHRSADRVAWFHAARNKVNNCNLVFLDPDNGLETANFNAGARKAGKSVALAELAALRSPGRTIIVYHHQTRMAGGHILELSHWGKRLSQIGFSVDALRASAFSARAFFLLNATPEIRSRAEAFAHKWGERVSWHPDLGKPKIDTGGEDSAVAV